MIGILQKWKQLSKDEREFVLRIKENGGFKYGGEPHYINSDEEDENGYKKQIALWENPEELGFIKCIGSYKWIVTEQYIELENYLMVYMNE